MSLEIATGSPGTEYDGGLKTELTLGLPGARPAQEPKPGEKRGFSETVDLNVGSNFEDEGVVTPKLPAGTVLNERRVMDTEHWIEFVPTYEDRDGEVSEKLRDCWIRDSKTSSEVSCTS